MSANSEKIVSYILALAENFQHSLSSELIEMWLKLLSIYTPEQVHGGVLRLICDSTSKRFPPFGELKQAIENASGILSGEKMLRLAAESEWNKLMEAVRTKGSYADQTAALYSTTQYALRVCGGWRAACLWSDEDLQWRKRDFVGTWMQAYGREAALEKGAVGVMALAASGPNSLGERQVQGIVASALRQGPTLPVTAARQKE